MDAQLVLALGSFLQVQHLLSCIGGQQDNWTEKLASVGLPVVEMGQAEVMETLLLRNRPGMVLVVCQDFDPLVAGGFVAKHFDKNVVWLVPEASLIEIERLPLNLNSFVVGRSVNRL